MLANKTQHGGQGVRLSEGRSRKTNPKQWKQAKRPRERFTDNFQKTQGRQWTVSIYCKVLCSQNSPFNNRDHMSMILRNELTQLKVRFVYDIECFSLHLIWQNKLNTLI